MSIDGKWIRKNEVREFREGPFVEDNITVLRQKVKDKFNEASSLFHDIEFFMSKDNFDELFPDDSFEMGMLDIYSSSYKLACDFDLSDINSIKSSIDGFDYVIPGVKRVVESLKNAFYPGINSRDFDISHKAQSNFRRDQAKFYMDQINEMIAKRGINLEGETYGGRGR